MKKPKKPINLSKPENRWRKFFGSPDEPDPFEPVDPAGGLSDKPASPPGRVNSPLAPNPARAPNTRQIKP